MLVNQEIREKRIELVLSNLKVMQDIEKKESIILKRK